MHNMLSLNEKSREMRFSVRMGALFLILLLVVFVQQSAARTVTDEVGRQLSVPDPTNLRRIVSLAPSITEVIFALGKEDLLAGVTQFSDYPPEAKDLPRVGSYVHLDLEKIVALKPDLCIGIKDGNPVAVVQKLERLGIPVYAIDPRDINGVLETITKLGHLLGAGKQAEKHCFPHAKSHGTGKILGRQKPAQTPRLFSNRRFAHCVSGHRDLYS